MRQLCVDVRVLEDDVGHRVGLVEGAPADEREALHDVDLVHLTVLVLVELRELERAHDRLDANVGEAQVDVELLTRLVTDHLGLRP